MRVYLFLLSYITFLQLTAVRASNSSRTDKEEDNHIDPFELARQLSAEICAINRSQTQEFYKAQRDAENRDWKFPGATMGRQIYNQRRPEVSWSLRAVHKILAPYLGRRLENVTVNLFTWCVFPLSTTMEIYGCVNSTDRWGSPGFRALGLLDIISLKNVSRLAHKRGRLVINTSENVHLSVLRGALVSCTIRLTDGSTIGVYYQMDLVQRSRGSSFVGISPQADAFLVEGQQKNFTCQSEGDEVFGYRWFQKTESRQFKYVCEDVFTKVEERCNYSSSYQLIIKEEKKPDCELEIAHSLRYESTNSVLFFASPTVDDTGEMLCNSTSKSNSRGRSIYIAVVFIELPPKSVGIKEGSSLLLTCEMKAPSDSEVYWTRYIEECLIPTMNEASPAPGNDTNSVLLCNTTAAVSKTVKEVDKNYSIFHLELQVPEVNFEHHGTYTCNVKYKIGPLTEPQLIQQHSSISVIDQGKSIQ